MNSALNNLARNEAGNSSSIGHVGTALDNSELSASLYLFQ